MRKYFNGKIQSLLLAGVLLAGGSLFSSCNTLDGPCPAGGERVRLTVSTGAETKATVAATADEKNVDHVDWFIYDGNGSLYRHIKPGDAEAVTASTAEIELPRDSYSVIAIVNYPSSIADSDMSTPSRYGTSLDVDIDDYFTASGVNYTSDVFVMRPDAPVEFEVDGDVSVTVPVKRVGCKIVFSGNVSFTDDYKTLYPAAEDQEVLSWFLINIVDDVLVSDGKHVSPYAYEKDWYDVSDLSGVPTNTTQTTFYCHPNRAEEAASWAGEDRVTKLVIQTRRGFYPIGIPNLKCNECVEIGDVLIDGLGSSRPNEYIPDLTTVRFSVTLLPWVEDSVDDEVFDITQVDII